MDKDTIIYSQRGEGCVTRIICFACNNNCIGCIVDSKGRSRKEYSWPELQRILSEFPEDTGTIDINGGEPTCSPHFIKAISHIRERYPDALLNILSNGRMFRYPSFTNSILKVLPKRARFLIALYGHDSLLHDSITRTPCSFRETIAGIGNLISAGCDVEVRVIVNRMNADRLPDIARFAKRFACSRIVFIHSKMIGEAGKNRKAVLVRFDHIAPKLEKAIKIIGKRAELFHFPYCVLPETIWPHIRGVTVPESEIAFGPMCKSCKKRPSCPGIWRSYASIEGFAELRRIR